MKFLFTLFILSSLFAVTGVTAQTPQQLNEIDAFVQHQQQKDHIPGLAVCIVNDSDIIFAKGYGKTPTGKTVTIHTPFAIASLSKAFTAAAVLQLADQGKVNIDSPAITYIRSLPQQLKNITVRELLNQTSGLSDRIFPELKFSRQPDNADAAIRRLHDVQLKDKPGTKFQYHNPNYQLLAKIVETVSGQPFNKYLQEHLLHPLKMNETNSCLLTQDFYRTGMTYGYNYFFGHAYALKEPDWFVEGAAGMTSSVSDMAKWMMFNLHHGRNPDDTLLSEKTVDLMQSVPKHVKSQYGMGWLIGNDSTISHSGILWTYHSELMLMRKQRYGILVLFNSGLNAFQDYSTFATNISKILVNRTITVNNSFIWSNLIIAAFMLIVIVSVVIRFKTMKNWKSKMDKVTKIGCAANIFLRLLPLLILLLIPTFLTAISGRVLNWSRIVYAMPEIIIWLILLSLFNVGIIIFRLNSYKKIFSRKRI